MDKQIQTFSLNPPNILFEEGKWLLAVSSFECTNSVFNIIKENNSFAVIIPGHWDSESVGKAIGEFQKLLEVRSHELHVKDFKKEEIKKK